MEKKKSIINKLWERRHELRSLPQSVWFNFHYLPWRQAIHLPILLYKPRIVDGKGSVKICLSGGGKTQIWHD